MDAFVRIKQSRIRRHRTKHSRRHTTVEAPETVLRIDRTGYRLAVHAESGRVRLHHGFDCVGRVHAYVVCDTSDGACTDDVHLRFLVAGRGCVQILDTCVSF